MNIETLTVEYVRTGRALAEFVLSDNEVYADMPQLTLESLERLRARECPPRNTADIVATVRKALSAADEAARVSLNATSSMTPARDKASQRTYCLRMLRDALGAFEAASDKLLDHLAATDLQNTLVEAVARRQRSEEGIKHSSRRPAPLNPPRSEISLFLGR